MASKKEVFDLFPNLSRYAAPVKPADPPAHLTSGEFSDTVLHVLPALPKTEVSLRVQFRCSVHLVEGDTVLLTLAGFKGEPQSFGVEARPHPDGFDAAQHFRGFWSGDKKIKGGKKVKGIPPKQTIVLQVIQRIEEGTLVVLGVPFTVGLVSPDKQPANSIKLKIEGNVRHALDGKVEKQPFLTSSEIKKETILEELEVYGRLLSKVVEEGGIRKDDQHVGESLSQEEYDQLWMTAQHRPPHHTAMPFPFALRAFHRYEETGGFIKLIMEAAVQHVKKRDPLALHREVAVNWGVKEGAVVLLESVVVSQCGHLYPNISRSAVLACHLLTMTPADIIRVFGLTGAPDTLPKFSILQELNSAYRSYEVLMRNALAATQTASPNTTNNNNNNSNNNNNNFADAGEVPQVYSARCERFIKRWSSLLACLLTATYVAEENTNLPNNEEEGGEKPNEGEEERRKPVVSFEERERPVERESCLLLPPPSLYVAVRDLPPAEIEYLQSLPRGEWYMFPQFVMAYESFPPIEKMKQPKVATATEGQETTNDNNNNDDEDENTGEDCIPTDDAVVFELQGVQEALELANVSMHPNNREWLLPFGPSFRVVSVQYYEQTQRLTHVILRHEGSVAGEVGDDYIPLGDRNVAGMVKGKVASGLEQADLYASYVAQLLHLHIKLQARRRQHAPTLIRAQYLSHYQSVLHGTQSKEAAEKNYVQWQVRTHAPSFLEEDVVRPASWEPLPAKYLEKVEFFFLERNKNRLLLEEGTDAKNGPTLVLNLENYTIAYGGKEPRPLRRLAGNVITHEGIILPYTEYDELQVQIDECQKKILTLQQKLGLVAAPEKKGKGKKAAPAGKKTKKKK